MPLVSLAFTGWLTGHSPSIGSTHGVLPVMTASGTGVAPAPSTSGRSGDSGAFGVAATGAAAAGGVSIRGTGRGRLGTGDVRNVTPAVSGERAATNFQTA